MKSLTTTLVIVSALVLLLLGVSKYITNKVELREKEATFALTPGMGQTAAQKQILQQIQKSVTNAVIILLIGGFLLFVTISHLNKPKANTLLKQSSNQL